MARRPAVSCWRHSRSKAVGIAYISIRKGIGCFAYVRRFGQRKYQGAGRWWEGYRSIVYRLCSPYLYSIGVALPGAGFESCSPLSPFDHWSSYVNASFSSSCAATWVSSCRGWQLDHAAATFQGLPFMWLQPKHLHIPLVCDTSSHLKIDGISKVHEATSSINMND